MNDPQPQVHHLFLLKSPSYKYEIIFLRTNVMELKENDDSDRKLTGCSSPIQNKNSKIKEAD